MGKRKPAASDPTEEIQADHRFKAGVSGNPAGRPKGSRSKLSESFLSSLSDDFDLHGQDVIRKVRAETPQVYLKVVANLIPAKLEAKIEVDVHNFEAATSVDEVLQLVARDAGYEAALHLAQAFNIEVPETLADGMLVLPPKAMATNPHPTGTANWRDWNRRMYGTFDIPQE